MEVEGRESSAVPESVMEPMNRTLANVKELRTHFAEFMPLSDSEVLDEMPPLQPSESLLLLAKITATLFACKKETVARFQAISDSTLHCNVNSCNGGPVILSWPGNMVGMITRSLCLFAALDDGNKENNEKSDAIDVEYYDRHAKACARDTEPLHLVEKMMEDCRKAQRVIQVESVRAQQELAAERYDGCCEGQLVKMTISGLQQPVGIEIADAAMDLGAEKLSLLVFEAHKDAFRKTVEAFQDKVRSLEAYLDMPEQAFREGIL